jgi:hypothetical protein
MDRNDMAVERVADMTLDELKALIDERIQQTFKPKEVTSSESRSVEEILDAIDRNMWTPSLGAKSSLELPREDRDSCVTSPLK